MTESFSLQQFINECQTTCQEFVTPVDIVLEISPLMLKLLNYTDDFLKDEHFQSNQNHYSRNPVYFCEQGQLSLFTMVWEPGQWTPVHDHGTWGVVGIIDGVLEERNFIRTDTREREDSGIKLHRGGLTLLSPGSVTTFVPNPDHIHRTGVSRSRPRAVSLHLYGRKMNNYNVYDLELGRRRRIELEDETLAKVAKTTNDLGT